MNDDSETKTEPHLDETSVRVVRLGHGANCSSVGSVIDTLFLSATVGGALLAAVLAAMKTEGVTVVGQPREPAVSEDHGASADAGDAP